MCPDLTTPPDFPSPLCLASLLCIPASLPQVVIHGLPFAYGTDQMREMMKSVGTVLDCRVAKDQQGRNKGWGTVLFDSPATAEKAIQVGGGGSGVWGWRGARVLDGG